MSATLRAEGVVLRPLEVNDAKALFLAHGDADIHRFWSGPPHRDEAETARSIEQTLTLLGAQAWAITEDGGEALGRIALFVRREGVGELGVILRREAQGRGIAAKALKLVEAYAFEVLKLHRLFADVDPENSPSFSLFIRAGFQREAVLRQNWKTHLGLRDSIILAKLRDERPA
ncbi:MAG: GNAT family protein [Pseudomonadota bacterium]